MTLDDLTVNFRHLDARALLEDWTWLIGEHRLPVLVTVAGDAFVQDKHDGSVHFLDAIEGSLMRVADSGDEFNRLLGQQQFVIDFFAFHTVAPLLRAGKRPGPGEVFAYEIPPVLGGEQSPGKLELIDMAVHFSLLGQIFAQVRNLPPGSPAADIQLRD